MDVNIPTDRANTIPWPPILFLAMVLAAWGLETTVPIPLPGAAVLRWAGVVLSMCGLGLAAAGAAQFIRIGTQVSPVGRPSKLATGGIYRLTRNPMYLGECVLLAGVALVLGSMWLLAAVPFVAFGLRQLAILPEEAFLTRRFGDEYRAYQARVGRWI